MINNKPNIFEFATKELSQDAVLLYLADCFNNKATESIGKAFLKAFDCDIEYLNHVYPIKQFNKIDVLVVLEFNDYYDLLVIEDKTASSSHDNQLERYKEYIDGIKEFIDEKRGITCKKPIKNRYYVYFKPLIYNENEKWASENSKYVVKKHEDLIPLLQMECNDHIWTAFKEYYRWANERELQFIKAEYLEELKEFSIDDIMSSYCGQWVLAKLLFKDSEHPFKYGRLYQGSSYGRPWTQYRFIIDNDSKEEYWTNLKFADEIRGKYSYFFRLDSNSNGYYIACNQYIYDKDKSKDKHKSTELYELMNELRKLGISHLRKGKGAKETTLWLFQFNSIDDLVSIMSEIANVQKSIICSSVRK